MFCLTLISIKNTISCVTSDSIIYYPRQVSFRIVEPSALFDSTNVREKSE